MRLFIYCLVGPITKKIKLFLPFLKNFVASCNFAGLLFGSGSINCLESPRMIQVCLPAVWTRGRISQSQRVAWVVEAFNSGVVTDFGHF